jgi:phage-related protein
MPQSEPLPIVGARCHALRIRDDRHSWRIVYRADDDAIVVVEVYAKKTRKIPDQIINVCKRRLRAYEEV